MSLTDKRTTKLSIIEDVQPKYGDAYTDYTYEKDITEMTTSDLIDVVVQTMKVMGYHDVAIWRALKEKCDDLEEYFESIDKSKDEWTAEYDNITNND